MNNHIDLSWIRLNTRFSKYYYHPHLLLMLLLLLLLLLLVFFLGILLTHLRVVSWYIYNVHQLGFVCEF